MLFLTHKRFLSKLFFDNFSTVKDYKVYCAAIQKASNYLILSGKWLLAAIQALLAVPYSQSSTEFEDDKTSPGAYVLG
jgi:hypothetical protein